MYEIIIGLYGTAKDVTRIGTAAADLLEARALGASLSIVDGGGRHDDLAEQWRITHPGTDPGTRAAFELRVGLESGPVDVAALTEAITRVVCPDPEHSTPCRVPWDSYWREN
ncbi:hypothetical protein Afil01_65670 [Actinorhabdospora filicis]|uniref:Uncharacterized protein n=1 Tax=Actinorhabdospora filicis TaxID=1785913 RepID=A0A9W6SRU3_9ACTN|nr:hypothetical protein [Actinorhabdospora filicis]GLZ81760.1 hypothetical protein Afil01_65670 [Actinorhabdospora filicis]